MSAPVERVEIGGLRHYRTPDGTFPSVTTILKLTKEAADGAGLDAWVERVGRAEADRVKTAASRRGNRLHRKAELWLRRRGWELPEGVWAGDGKDRWWASLAPFLRAVVDCHAVEQYVWHAGVRYAGALDAVLTVRSGKTWLVDWKTSGRPSISSDALRDYRCQGAAYVAAARERGIYAHGACLVIAHDSAPAEVLFLPTAHLEGAWTWFQRRAARFHAEAGGSVA